MKSLQELVSESILDVKANDKKLDNAYKLLYPTPKTKDFVKTIWGGLTIEWECKLLLQQHIDKLDIPDFGHYNKHDVYSLIVDIHKDKTITTSLGINDKEQIELTGVGDWVSSSLQEIKKETLKFFKYIQENPGSITL